MEVLYFRLAERVIVAMCAPILLYIGYRLFESGATGKMNLTAKSEGYGAKLTNLSPGALCFVLSVALGAFIMFSRVEVTPSDGDVDMISAWGGAERRGPPIEEHRLSARIEGVYMEMAFELQDRLRRPDTTIEEVRKTVASVVGKNRLRREASRNSLAEIKDLETGRTDSPQALSKWREDYLGGTDQ